MKKFIAIYIICFSLVSCEGLLETNPTESIDLDVAANSESGLNGLLIDIYDDLQTWWMYGSRLICGPDLMADNIFYTRTTGWYEDIWSNRSTIGEWQFAYGSINKANIIIANGERLRLEEDLSSTEIKRLNQLIGQAYALRALLHFHLVNAYAYSPTAIVSGRSKGGIPLQLNPVTALGDVETKGRATIDEVYNQMVADLQEAILIMDNDHSATVNNGLIGQAAAQALLSRIALYAGDWETAASAASDAIASQQARLSDRENYANDWDAAYHPEALFLLIFQINEPVNINVALQRIYTTVNRRDPDYVGGGTYLPSDGYLALIDSNDVRRSILQMGRMDRLEVTKFTGDAGGTHIDNIPIIRLTEMYLNRAEAYAQLRRNDEAIADLDLIRQRSYGDAFSPTTAIGDDLLDVIYLERRLELAFEGHRWYDLKRWGQDLDKSDLTGQMLLFEADHRWLAPIPQQELELNPNLEQNFGY